MIVFDSSALLALVFEEPGGDRVLSCLPGNRVSAVNHSEVVMRIVERGRSFDEAKRIVTRMQLEIASFDRALAERAAELQPTTAAFGLSLGDRACIALAERLGARVMTADRQWAKARLPVEIELIR